MNLLTHTRLAANIVLAIALAALAVAVLLGNSIEPMYVIGIGVVAILGGVAQFVMSIAKPKDIKPAWDEQTISAHNGSYKFGYWIALVSFWLLFALVRYAGIEIEHAFLWVGAVLICAPSICMAVSTLSGRAG